MHGWGRAMFPGFPQVSPPPTLPLGLHVENRDKRHATRPALYAMAGIWFTPARMRYARHSVVPMPRSRRATAYAIWRWHSSGRRASREYRYEYRVRWHKQHDTVINVSNMVYSSACGTIIYGRQENSARNGQNARRVTVVHTAATLSAMAPLWTAMRRPPLRRTAARHCPHTLVYGAANRYNNAYAGGAGVRNHVVC